MSTKERADTQRVVMSASVSVDAAYRRLAICILGLDVNSLARELQISRAELEPLPLAA